MRCPDLSIVPLDMIPETPYKTPSDNVALLYATAKKMEALCEGKKGMGLAASQVGLPWKMFVACSEYPLSKNFHAFFDCLYGPVGDEKFSSLEGCLSIPGDRFRVQRYASVIVEGFMIVEGDEGASAVRFSKVFNGIPAVIMQHEIDHDFGRDKMIDVVGSRVVLA